MFRSYELLVGLRTRNSFAPRPKPRYVNNLSDSDKEAIIASTLETDEGRAALAAAMVEPIRRSLEYQSIGRRLLMVDELPQGALPRYERDVAAVAHIVSRGDPPSQIVEGEEILVPTFEVAASPTVRLSEIRARRFQIYEATSQAAREAVQREEDTNIFNALRAAAGPVDPNATIEPATLAEPFRNINPIDLESTRIVMQQYGRDSYDEATQAEILQTGMYGHQMPTSERHLRAFQGYQSES